MLQPPASITSAAAFLAVALFFLVSACGDSDSSPTPSGSADGDVPSDSPGPGEVLATQVDLASEQAVGIVGAGAEDMLTGTTSLDLGDFNDDGEPDLLVGAPQGDGANDERAESGEVYVILGPLDQTKNLATEGADLTIYGGSPGDGLGYSVLTADINDDGIDDALVGAPGVTAGSDPRTDQGQVYAFYGSREFGDGEVLDLKEDVSDFAIIGAEGFSRLGHAMAGGDVNGDGATDLVLGAPFAGRAPGSPPGSERTALGEAYIIFGHEQLSGVKNVAFGEYDALLSGANAFGEFGASVAVADLNGDDLDDVIVGAYRASAGDPARESSGAAYIFYGREQFESRLSAQDGDEDVTVLGGAGATFGYPLAVGDFNGDGVGDVAAGAQLENAGDLQSPGTVRVFLGGERLPSEIDLEVDRADVLLSGGESSELLPSSLEAADINGNGGSELIVGSMLVAGPEDRFASGVVYVFSLTDDTGAGPGSTRDATSIVLGAAAGDRLGNALASGDLGSGVTAVVAMAPLADAENQPDAGVVYVLSLRS